MKLTINSIFTLATAIFLLPAVGRAQIMSQGQDTVNGWRVEISTPVHTNQVAGVSVRPDGVTSGNKNVKDGSDEDVMAEAGKVGLVEEFGDSERVEFEFTPTARACYVLAKVTKVRISRNPRSGNTTEFKTEQKKEIRINPCFDPNERVEASELE